MQPNTSITPRPQPSPAQSVNRLFRWQVILALLGIMLLLVTLLSYSSYTLATELVPEKGGIFREGVAGSPKYLSPLRCQADNDIDQDICVLLFRGMTKVDSNGQVVPDLAETWTISNNTVYTFRLRPEQYWGDGQPITADDVMFTVGIIQDPELTSLPSLSRLWRSVQAEKLDNLTVRFTLSEPFSPFLDYTAMALMPQHVWGEWPATELARERDVITQSAIPVGNGPFRIAEISANSVRLEPNPFYNGDIPYINSLELVFYSDHPSALTAFLNDEVDGVSRVLPVDLPAVAELSDVNLYNSILPSYTNILFNLRAQSAPFLQEPAVRKALYHAVDRQRIVQEVLADQGVVANSLFPPQNWAYNAGVLQYEYSPQRAAELLNEAGWIDTNGDNIRDKDGQTLAFQLAAGSSHQSVIERVASEWAAIGVQVTPIVLDEVTQVVERLNQRDFDAVLIGWEVPGDPDPYGLWHSSQADNPGQNYSGWSNPEADQLMEAARTVVELGERQELYFRLQEIFNDDVPAIMLYHPIYTYAIGDHVKNAQIGLLNHPSERFLDFADWYINERRIPATQLSDASVP